MNTEQQFIETLRSQALEIADEGHSGWGNTMLDAARILADKEAEIAELKSHNNFDAARLRRLVSLCGVAAPDSDEELLQVAGVVIGSCLRVLQSPSSMIDPHYEIGVLKHHLSSKNKQLTEANALMTRMEEALKEAIELADALVESMDYVGTGTSIKVADALQQKDRETLQRLRAILSTSPESLAAWEAEKLEPLQKQVAMLRAGLIEIAERNYVDTAKTEPYQSLLHNTQATAEAYDREHAAKVPEEYANGWDTDIAQEIRQDAAELRAANKKENE